MARIAVHEPVSETRELLERLVRRLGHDVVAWDAAGAVREVVDVLLFEPASDAAVAHARRVRAADAGVGLVACSATPASTGLADLRPILTLTQPFAPADLARALENALGGRQLGRAPAA